jgi:hypothetical protein
VAINNKSYVIIIPYSNIIFYLISIKLFYKTDKLIKAKTPKPKYSSEDVYKDIIIINTINNTIPALSLKRDKGRLYKNPNITLFL